MAVVHGSLEASMLTHFLMFKTYSGRLVWLFWDLFSAPLSCTSWAHSGFVHTVRGYSCSPPFRPAGRDEIK